MGNIQKSIDQYYHLIMRDINLSVRIVVEGEEEKTYASRLMDWKGKKLTFHAPLVKGDYVRFLRDKIYTFIFVTGNCTYMTYVKIVEFSKDDKEHFYYKAIIKSPLTRNQQRRFFRLQWVEPFIYTIGESSQWEKAATLDISGGGFRIVSQKKMRQNDQIHIKITLFEHEIELFGIVLEEMGKNQADLYVYRIQFHNISSDTENLISKLVMRKQRDLLKKT